MDKDIKFVINREEMKLLSAKQILIEKEKLEHGEHVLLVNEIFVSSISFQNAKETVRNIKEKIKLREFEVKTPKF